MMHFCTFAALFGPRGSLHILYSHCVWQGNKCIISHENILLLPHPQFDIKLPSGVFHKYQSYKLNTYWQCEWWKQVKLKCDLPVWVKFPRWFCSSLLLRARDLGLSKAYQFSTKLVTDCLAYFWFTDVVLFYFPSISCTPCILFRVSSASGTCPSLD